VIRGPRVQIRRRLHPTGTYLLFFAVFSACTALLLFLTLMALS
jgi:hypothetical protein